jgi:murein DD-endopeptidase MepM/ murein hydrolase activator NlpD
VWRDNNFMSREFDSLANNETGPNREQAEKRPITPETTEWEPDLETGLPVDGRDLPNFRAWINWNDADIDKTGQRKKYHQGVDFAAYITNDNKIMLGLPEGTPVRAIADGRIGPNTVGGGGYHAMVELEHGKINHKLLSKYKHVVPVKFSGQVKQGDIIGHIYVNPLGTFIDNPNGRSLGHVHLELHDGFKNLGDMSRAKREEMLVSPLDILGTSIRQFTAAPQAAKKFVVSGLEGAEIELANGLESLADLELAEGNLHE